MEKLNGSDSEDAKVVKELDDDLPETVLAS